VVWKPLFLTVKWNAWTSWNNVYIMAENWVVNGYTTSNSYFHYIGTASWAYGSSVAMYIPNSTTVMFKIKWHTSSASAPAEVYAYQ
jgi:hypothetical protein